MRLNIELVDVNDQMPLFGGLDENGRYSGSIAENLEAGAEFITVTATDKDEFPDFKKVTSSMCTKCTPKYALLKSKIQKIFFQTSPTRMFFPGLSVAFDVPACINY